MNFRLLFFGLIIAGSIVYSLIPETPTRKILVVTGCSPDDASWEHLELADFPGTPAQFNSTGELVWNRSGRTLKLELVEYGRGVGSFSSNEGYHLVYSGVHPLPEHPNFLMVEAPDQIRVSRGQIGVEVRWQLTCR